MPQHLGCEFWQPADFCVRYGHQHLPFSWECFLSEKHAKLHSFKKQRRPIPAAKDGHPCFPRVASTWLSPAGHQLHSKKCRHFKTPFFPPSERSRAFLAVPMRIWDHYFGVTQLVLHIPALNLGLLQTPGLHLNASMHLSQATQCPGKQEGERRCR